MASIIDLEKFGLPKEYVQTVAELSFQKIVETPDINDYMTIFSDIVAVKEVGYVTEGGLLGVEHKGCGGATQEYSVGTRLVTWEAKSWEAFVGLCVSDLAPTIGIYSTRNKIPFSDFTQTDYTAVLTEVFANSLKEMIHRFAWFSKTDMTQNELSAGVTLDYFKVVDGFFKQMAAQFATNASQRVTIAENAGASYAAQALDPANVQGYLSKLITQASLRLRGESDNVIFCTQSFYDAYKASLSGTAIESMYTNLVDGNKTLMYDGIPLVVIRQWDNMLAKYFNNGTKITDPHRAVFTNKRVLGMGVDNINSPDSFEAWYSKDTRKVLIQAMGRIDFKLTDPELFTIAI